MDLARKRDRLALAVRREPHWQRLAKGAYLGFRRGPNTWHARYRDQAGKQNWHPLEGIQPDDFDGAKRAAEAWLAQLSGSPVRRAKRDTVKAALETYLADLRRHGRADAATDAEGRFRLTVYGDALAGVSLESATREDFLDWRDRLKKGRLPRSVNRQVRSVVAALNQARELGHVGNREAWKLRPLTSDASDEGETAIFLTAEQRKAIYETAPAHAAAFLRGLELTGARPGELAAATAGDFDGRTLRLRHRKGRPPKWRERFVTLGSDGVEFFKRQAARKLPGAFLFTEDGEQQWRRHVWARQFRAAADKINEKARGTDRIPPAASVYSFRHARISELLQIHGVDPLTVAHQTGTSVAMIEKAYLRFIPSAMREKLAAVKLP